MQLRGCDLKLLLLPQQLRSRHIKAAGGSGGPHLRSAATSSSGTCSQCYTVHVCAAGGGACLHRQHEAQRAVKLHSRAPLRGTCTLFKPLAREP